MDLNDYKKSLSNRLVEIDREVAAASDTRAVVTLDQQAVGRLTRMDALQQQAMAKATHARRLQLRRSITAALNRLNNGEFGYCLECGSEIAPKRLQLNPAVPLCITCATQ